jgi:hypothetical protein
MVAKNVPAISPAVRRLNLSHRPWLDIQKINHTNFLR